MAIAGSDPKALLLEATMAYVAEHGVTDLTLRSLAPALNTSHRMLVYHFGSKEGLLVEVVREVERRQRETLMRLEADGSLTLSEQIMRSWRRLADPAMWPHERLFFEIYSHALQGRTHAVRLLDDVVEAWLNPLTKVVARHGLSEADARAEARLALAVTRGLLLDLLATRDSEGVERAMMRFVRGFEERVTRVAAVERPNNARKA